MQGVTPFLFEAVPRFLAKLSPCTTLPLCLPQPVSGRRCLLSRHVTFPSFYLDIVANDGWLLPVSRATNGTHQQASSTCKGISRWLVIAHACFTSTKRLQCFTLQWVATSHCNRSSAVKVSRDYASHTSMHPNRRSRDIHATLDGLQWLVVSAGGYRKVKWNMQACQRYLRAHVLEVGRLVLFAAIVEFGHEENAATFPGHDWLHGAAPMSSKAGLPLGWVVDSNCIACWRIPKTSNLSFEEHEKCRAATPRCCGAFLRMKRL